MKPWAVRFWVYKTWSAEDISFLGSLWKTCDSSSQEFYTFIKKFYKPSLFFSITAIISVPALYCFTPLKILIFWLYPCRLYICSLCQGKVNVEKKGWELFLFLTFLAAHVCGIWKSHSAPVREVWVNEGNFQHTSLVVFEVCWGGEKVNFNFII